MYRIGEEPLCTRVSNTEAKKHQNHTVDVKGESRKPGAKLVFERIPAKATLQLWKKVCGPTYASLRKLIITCSIRKIANIQFRLPNSKSEASSKLCIWQCLPCWNEFGTKSVSWKINTCSATKWITSFEIATNQSVHIGRKLSCHMKKDICNVRVVFGMVKIWAVNFLLDSASLTCHVKEIFQFERKTVPYNPTQYR